MDQRVELVVNDDAVGHAWEAGKAGDDRYPVWLP